MPATSPQTSAGNQEMRAALDNIGKILQRWDELPAVLRDSRIAKVRQIVSVTLGDAS